MRKIFDAHTHIYPDPIAEKAVTALGHFYNFVPTGKGTASALLDDSENNARRGFLILSVATNAHQVRRVNEYAAEAVNDARARGFAAYGFAGIHQDCSADEMVRELSAARANGLCGLKIHPDIQGCDINDKRFYPAYDWLQENDLPLYLHMGDDRPQYRFSEPGKLAALLRDFPRLRVGASHLGGYRATEEAKEVLYHLDNVFYDTSSSLWYLPPETARALILSMNPERVMFGTDFPVMRLGEELSLFDALHLPDALAEKILFSNAGLFLKNAPHAAEDFA